MSHTQLIAVSVPMYIADVSIVSSGDFLEGKGGTIRSVLCNIACNNWVQCDAHTYEQTNSSLDWVLSHWANFTVLRFIFACIMCIIVYCVHV